MADLDEKKKILLERQQSMARKQKTIMISVVLLLVIAVAGYSYISYQSNPVNKGGDYNIGSEVSYEGKNIEMTAVDLKSEGDYVSIPIEKIKSGSIVKAEFREVKKNYYNDLDYLPFMAFVSPAGRIIAATSLCEPCYATSFHIEGSILVCNVCNTRWRLSDLMGQSGGCTSFPPEILKYTVKDDKLLIAKDDLINWVPRAYKDEMKDYQ